jgi:hypothetical protein
MNMHIIVLYLLGAVLFSAGFLVWRIRRYNRKVRVHNEVVERAVAQMRQTGIFFSLGLNPMPDDIERLQSNLAAHWGYEGPIDGHPNTEMLEAIDRQASAAGIDVDEEVQRLVLTPRSPDEQPSEEKLLSQAQERLIAARSVVRIPSHKIS